MTTPRFALFMWHENEPAGGAADFVAFGEHVEQLMSLAEVAMLQGRSRGDFAHIAQVDTMSIVMEGALRAELHSVPGHPPTKRVDWTSTQTATGFAALVN